MFRATLTALACWAFFLVQSYGQDVFVPRELKSIPVSRPNKEQSADNAAAPTHPVPNQVAKPATGAKPESVEVPTAKPQIETGRPEKARTAKADSTKPKGLTEPAAEESEGAQPVRAESHKAKSARERLANLHADRAQAKIEPDDLPGAKESSGTDHSGKTQSLKGESDTRTVNAKKKQSEKSELLKRSADAEAIENTHSKAQATKFDPVKPLPEREPINPQSERTKPTNNDAMKGPSTKEAENSHPEKVRSTKEDLSKSSVAKETKPNPIVEKGQPTKVEIVKASLTKDLGLGSRPDKIDSSKVEPGNMASGSEPIVSLPVSDKSMETGSTKLADGFDFPVGKPEGEGYYKARGFRSGGHMGEDWDGVRGGDTDLGDPIYCIGNGIVVFARDVHRGWGNVVIVRHAFREGGSIQHIDSLYGHLDSILVRRGERVARGQQVGTMGTAHGQYDAHLHLEVRKNLEIGMSRAKFAKNFSNYYDPSQFIESHRHLPSSGANFRVAMNTFTHDGAFHFDAAPNSPPRKRSTSQSATALKQALSSGNH